MKSWEAPESNRMITGCPNSEKVPAGTSSPLGISSTVVWLTRLLLNFGALISHLCWITADVGNLGALPFLGSGHYWTKCPTRLQLKHGALTIMAFCWGTQGDTGCGDWIGVWGNTYCCCGWCGWWFHCGGGGATHDLPADGVHTRQYFSVAPLVPSSEGPEQSSFSHLLFFRQYGLVETHLFNHSNHKSIEW
jgi:hypothetical protein